LRKSAKVGRAAIQTARCASKEVHSICSRNPDSTAIGEARRADVSTQPPYAPSGKSTTWTRFQLTPDRVRGITPAQHAPQRGAAVYGWKRKKPVNPTSSVS